MENSISILEMDWMPQCLYSRLKREEEAIQSATLKGCGCRGAADVSFLWEKIADTDLLASIYQYLLTSEHSDTSKQACIYSAMPLLLDSLSKAYCASELAPEVFCRAIFVTEQQVKGVKSCFGSLGVSETGCERSLGVSGLFDETATEEYTPECDSRECDQLDMVEQLQGRLTKIFSRDRLLTDALNKLYTHLVEHDFDPAKGRVSQIGTLLTDYRFNVLDYCRQHPGQKFAEQVQLCMSRKSSEPLYTILLATWSPLTYQLVGMNRNRSKIQVLNPDDDDLVHLLLNYTQCGTWDSALQIPESRFLWWVKESVEQNQFINTAQRRVVDSALVYLTKSTQNQVVVEAGRLLELNLPLRKHAISL